MTAFSFQIEPHLVLEIPPEATLQEIRDAYRRQAKKYHPDHGGTEWAFRLLARAYEVLSTARVERASQTASNPDAPAGSPPPQASTTEAPAGSGANGSIDPGRRVGVELLWVRYEAEPHWLRQDAAPDDHSLSCSLSFKWPDPTMERVSVEPEEVERGLGQLAGVFEAMCNQTRVEKSRIRVNQDTFTGWLSYSTVEHAAAAYRLLHEMLVDLDFGVHPWNRELLIPRSWH